MSTEVLRSPDQNLVPLYNRNITLESIEKYLQMISKIVSFRAEHVVHALKGGRGDDIVPQEVLPLRLQ